MKSVKNKKILLLSASVGSGHNMAARAVSKYLELSGFDGEVRFEDVLDYTNPVFRFLYRDAYLMVTGRFTHFFAACYDKADRPWKDYHKRKALFSPNLSNLRKMIINFNADIIICTHFLAAEAVTWLKNEGKISSKLCTVVTDIDPHAWWLCKGADHFFVAMGESKEYLIHTGVPADNISVSGIPIDPKFAQNKNKDEMWKKLSLAPDLPVIIVSGGGEGIGATEKQFDELRRLNNPAQLVVICGNNNKLKSRLEAYNSKLPADSNIKMHIVGYTTDMDEYMLAADLLIGKPGGMTVFEAMAMGLPMLIFMPLAGQEERNSDHLLEEGVAIRCNSLVTLPYKVDRLLSDPDRLRQMSENARKLGSPLAGKVIADKVLEMV